MGSGIAGIVGGGQALDPQQVEGITQLAMAVKSFKMQEKETKRQHAQQKAQLLMSNPALLVMTDPKDLEKTLKEGYDVKFTGDQPANPQNATQVPPPSGGAPGPSGGGPDPNAIAQLGKSTGSTGQGAGGATGVGTGISSAGTVEHLAAQAGQVQTDKLGKLAPLYLGAVDAMTMEHMKARTFQEIEHLKQKAAGGDFQSIGRLMMLSGKQVSDSDMRAMIATSNMDPKVINQALDFALGNETDADKAKREDSTLKTLMANPEFMGRLTNPADAAVYAKSIVRSGRLPEGIPMKPHSLQELTQEADYEKFLVGEAGLHPDFAHSISRMRTDGIPFTFGLPPGFHSLAERKVGAQEAQAEAAKISAGAERQKANNEAAKILADAGGKEAKDLNDQLALAIEADKAKHPWPEDVKTALINKVAEKRGLMPEEVKHWWQYVTGGHDMKYTPVPDDELASKAAGARPKEKPKAGAKSDTSIGSYLDILNRALGMVADTTTGAGKAKEKERRLGPQ